MTILPALVSSLLWNLLSLNRELAGHGRGLRNLHQGGSTYKGPADPWGSWCITFCIRPCMHFAESIRIRAAPLWGHCQGSFLSTASPWSLGFLTAWWLVSRASVERARQKPYCLLWPAVQITQCHLWHILFTAAIQKPGGVEKKKTQTPPLDRVMSVSHCRKSTWDGKCCHGHFWKIHSATKSSYPGMQIYRKKIWKNQPSWLQTVLQSYSHQNSIVLAQ